MTKYDNSAYQIVIFGATGDLTHRKLLPAFYNLFQQDQLPEELSILAIGRRDKDSQIYREEAYEAVSDNSRFDLDEDTWDDFAGNIEYLRFDFREDDGYEKLREKIIDKAQRIFYLAVSPDYFGLIVDKLDENELAHSDYSDTRVVIEKPFGRNLETARQLNAKINNVFPEKDIYRIDHYLGKEMLQNIMVIRFANSLFEPLWNNKYIDNIQIISNESSGVGERGGYYDDSGALRDMVQNHMMQLLTLTAMEPPVEMDTESIRNEKVKVLKALQLEYDNLEQYVVRGQYCAGEVDGEEVPAYRDEERTADDSITETFVALKLFINNLRWGGVPFYIKTGKRLTHKSTEVVVEFKAEAHPAYQSEYADLLPNILVIRIQPQEGIFFQFNAKKPGTEHNIVPVQMDYCQNCQLGNNSPEAYERLLFDIMRGDSTLFTRWDEVEYSWRFIDKIASRWQEKEADFPNYQAGTAGPEAADKLLADDGRSWWTIEGFSGEQVMIDSRGCDL
ncbi:MAG: glucose-6-phosphate dehydrogenase [Halanaerobiales bacterium]